MCNLSMYLLMTFVIALPTASFAPIRMVPDELESDDGLIVSEIKWVKQEYSTVQKFGVLSLNVRKDAYYVSFAVENIDAEPICKVEKILYGKETYAFCKGYLTKISIRNYATPIGAKKFIAVDVYNLKTATSSMRLVDTQN